MGVELGGRQKSNIDWQFTVTMFLLAAFVVTYVTGMALLVVAHREAPACPTPTTFHSGNGDEVTITP